MKNYTPQFTAEELADIGRVMEREGFSSLEEFVAAAVREKAARTQGN